MCSVDHSIFNPECSDLISYALTFIYFIKCIDAKYALYIDVYTYVYFHNKHFFYQFSIAVYMCSVDYSIFTPECSDLISYALDFHLFYKMY